MKPIPMPKVTPAQERMWVRRALAQYYRDNSDGTDWPAHAECHVKRHNTLNYVVLVDEEWNALACYRIRHPDRKKNPDHPDGRLMFVAAAPPWM